MPTHPQPQYGSRGVRYLRYIGQCAIKDDNVLRTGIRWHGHGDIQAVPDWAAPRLLSHRDVWEEVDAAKAEQLMLQDTLHPAGTVRKFHKTPDNLVRAIGMLDENDPTHFTRSGAPRVEALSEFFGEEVSGQERDDAWQVILDARELIMHGDDDIAEDTTADEEVH